MENKNEQQEHEELHSINKSEKKGQHSLFIALGFLILFVTAFTENLRDYSGIARFFLIMLSIFLIMIGIIKDDKEY